MGTTAAGIRYPEPTDRVADGATAMLNLASDVTALSRMRHLTLAGPTGELTSGTTVNAYADVLVLDATMPASVPLREGGNPARLVVWACYDGLWTGGAGGPNVRWLLNGAQAGQIRTSYSPANAYVGMTVVDWLAAPSAGAAFTLRLQYATGATSAVKVRSAVGGVILV